MIPRPTARPQLVVVSLLSVLLLTACVPQDPTPTMAATSESPPPPSATPTTPASSETTSADSAATANGDRLEVFAEPGGDATQTLSNPQESGAPLTLLVVEGREGWVKVSLPQRPNGSTGWVRAQDVTLNRLVYRLEVSTDRNTLTLFKDDRSVKTYPVATGTGGTPTPHGSFYLTELVEPTNGGYGPFAFGVSAFSDVLTSFGGGTGQIGLHGTDDESSIGRSVSHGCIRLSNADITELAGLLPLGTPITIAP